MHGAIHIVLPKAAGQQPGAGKWQRVAFQCTGHFDWVAIGRRIDRHMTLEAIRARMQQTGPLACTDLCDQPSGRCVHRFHVHAVDGVDAAMALLTGLPAGTPGPDGRYATGTVNGAVQEALERLSAAARSFATERLR